MRVINSIVISLFMAHVSDAVAQEKNWFTVVCEGQTFEVDLDGVQRDPMPDVRSFNVFSDFSVQYKNCVTKTERSAVCYQDVDVSKELFPFVSTRFFVSLNRVTGKVREVEFQAYDVRGMAKNAGLTEAQTLMLVKSKADENGLAHSRVEFNGVCKKSDAKKF
jgi:hypothetical protein